MGFGVVSDSFIRYVLKAPFETMSVLKESFVTTSATKDAFVALFLATAGRAPQHSPAPTAPVLASLNPAPRQPAPRNVANTNKTCRIRESQDRMSNTRCSWVSVARRKELNPARRHRPRS